MKTLNKHKKIRVHQLKINIPRSLRDFSFKSWLVLGRISMMVMVGINEWFYCGIDDFTNWKKFYSPDIFNQIEDKNINQTYLRP